MNKRKLSLGLLTAGIFSAGFGAAVFPASAELRTLTVTLLGGTTTIVTVDAPPGTPIDQIPLPGITTPIIGVSEGAPPPTDPGTGTDTTPTTAPTTDTSATPAPAPTPPATDVPQADGQTSQATTGSKKRHTVKGKSTVTATDVPVVVKKAAQKPTALRAADGAPTPADPTYSFALPGAAPVGVPNFFIDHFQIPPFLLSIYQAAGIQYGVRWEILAAINEIETDYGRNLSTSSAGAVGWMQFLPETWKQYGVDANGDGKRDPYNPVDAIFGAARYLKAAGAATDIRKAILAYNHAGWYADSVLLRARLIGGLPADLVGSLTGLTEGHFPVHATATYADDLSESAIKAKIAKSKNAAVPVDSNTARTGINIFAKPGSPVIAVQDGKVTQIGKSVALGRFVKLQDTYGNSYTYAHLGSVPSYYPVPKPQAESAKAVTRELKLPKAKDPAPTAPATAGSQPQKKVKAAAKTATHTLAKVTRSAPSTITVTKERIFANPTRPSAYHHGGQTQLLNAGATVPGVTTYKGYFSKVFGLKRTEVDLKRLKVGSKVIGGTILGRIGKGTSRDASHLMFQIRPAGKGAPLIDPKPILDGWKLLESTAIYRAKGINPFYGADAKDPSIGQILLMSKEQLQQRVLADPHVSTYSCGRDDIRTGQVDRRVLATIEFLVASGLDPTITALKCGHSLLTTSGNISEHSTGDAVDIAKVNGIPILGHQGPGTITDITIRRLLTLQGTMKPHQIISLMTFAGADNTLALPDHYDHIHVGFRPLYGSNSKLAKQFDAVLKPGQWIKLISRIGQISNPTVPVTPSKYAIPDSSTSKPGD